MPRGEEPRVLRRASTHGASGLSRALFRRSTAFARTSVARSRSLSAGARRASRDSRERRRESRAPLVARNTRCFVHWLPRGGRTKWARAKESLLPPGDVSRRALRADRPRAHGPRRLDVVRALARALRRRR